MDLRNLSENDIEQIFKSKIGNSPMIIVSSNHKKREWNRPLFRVRKNNINYKNENANSIKTFSLPPDSVVDRGRANILGKSVFYASNNIGTAIAETLNDRSNFFLSVWRLNDPFNLYEFVSTDRASSEVLKSRYYRKKAALKNSFREYSEDESEKLIESIAVQTSWFLRDSDYSLSSYLANNILHNFLVGSRFFDAIMYPSIKTDKRSVNFAFKRSFAEQNMRCERIFHINEAIISGDNYRINGLNRIGICNGDSISWKEPNDEDWNSLVQLVSVN